ncbi:MAG: thioredoxin-dependent thiol peroxidase [Candidatus Methanofastidiosum methylothiophilum]|uniref:Thioredoxin-dependent thiol peroxidase n=1 Tax=Candidatus Methanofastidiosum methylothiophilum TaxID=1705564 RepID=A0A150J6G0_9EURY|nr:MAG: thioredoxin-dependent thiol peroxidase [Candidatus Methanofastidiosum methylthiophilus]NMC77104.1 redoxin domain-containing protein [Candidatus Methanofastidiosa archaeon]
MQYEKDLVGRKAIEFCLKDKNNKKVCLNDLKTKWIVLFFFDKTSLDSPNSELLYYSKIKEEFDDLNVHVVGIGPVSEEEIKKFASEHDIKTTILSDLDYKISEEYGVVYIDKNEIKNILPMTFLINKSRIVSKVWNREKFYYRLSGYADNLIELWDQSKMWAHIDKIFEAIELLEKNEV